MWVKADVPFRNYHFVPLPRAMTGMLSFSIGNYSNYKWAGAGIVETTVGLYGAQPSYITLYNEATGGGGGTMRTVSVYVTILCFT
jgi:hypothetical protein